MKSILRSIIAPALFVTLAAGATACGGDHTGFKLTVDVPQTVAFRFPDNYDEVRVQITLDGSKTFGTSFKPTELEKPPYTYLIVADDEDYFKANEITVSLHKNGVQYEKRTQNDVKVQDGVLVPLTFEFKK